MNTYHPIKNASILAPKKPTWQAPKLTKHGDIASLTKQWLGPDGLLPMAPLLSPN